MHTQHIEQDLLALKAQLEDPAHWAAIRSGIVGPVMDEETDEEKAAREEAERKAKEQEGETAEEKAERERKEKEKDDEYERIPAAEAKALRKELAERRTADRKREKEERERKEKERAEAGKHEEIAAEAKKERDEAIAAKEKAESDLAEFKSQVTITKVAQRLGFKDPSDAYLFLDKDKRTEDEAAVERALKAVAREKKYLVDEHPSTGGGHSRNGGGGKDGLYTIEQIQQMSVDQIRANQDKVDRSMAALASG